MAFPDSTNTFAETMGGLAKIMNPASSGFKLSIDPEERALQSQVENLQSQLTEAGIDPALQKPRENLFWKTLNVLAKPMQIVEGVADSAFVRGDLSRVGLLGAAQRGMEERISGSDILRRAGIKSPLARGIAGFGLDFALDPIGLAKFGTKGLATAGGLALSAKGNKILKSATFTQGKELTKLLSKIDADDLLDDAAKTAAKADVIEQQSTSLFEGFKTLGQVRRDAENAKRVSNELGKTILRNKAQEGLDLAQSKLRVNLPSDIDEISELIARPSVRFEMGLPFLGHFTGKSKKALPETASTTQKLLTTAGNIFSPDTLRFGSFEIPPELGASLNAVGDVAMQGLSKVRTTAIKAFDAVKDVPYVGDIAQATKGGAEAIDSIARITGNALKRTFARSYLIGEPARDAELLQQTRIAALDPIGRDLMVRTFPEIASKEGRELVNGVGKQIDSLAFNTLDEFTKTATTLAKKNLVENLSRLAKEVDLPENTFDDLRELEPVFRERFQALLGTMSPEEQSIANRLVNSFDAMFQKEVSHGSPLNFFEYYLPHRFENVYKNVNPSAKRNFATLGEAFDKANLVGSTDVGSLWFRRWKHSEEKLARGQYFNRMVLENGFKVEDVNRLYTSAKFFPDEATAALMTRARQDPRIITKEISKLFEAEKLSEEAKQTIKRLGLPEVDQLTPTQVTKGKELSDITKSSKQRFGNISKLPQTDKVVKGAIRAADEATLSPGGLPTELQEEIADSVTRFSEEGRASHFLASMRPYSNEMPDPYHKEIADFIHETIGPNGEKVTHVVPVEIGRAIKENAQSKDLLKDALKNNDFGRASLKVMDAASNFFKRWNTLPWPGYWSQNLFGDSVMRWIDGGISSLSPGHLAKSYNLINDPSATMKLANGVEITGKTFQELLKRSGVSVTAKEMVDVVNAAGDLDIESWARKNSKNFKGHISAIAKAEKGGIPDALTAARETVEKNFENIFRVNHVLHRLEMGDTVGDAVRNATEAMINYRDFTDIEKSVLKRFYFFYGWTSKAIKKQAISLFTNPGDIRHQVTLAKNFAETFSEPGALPSADEREDELLRSITEREQLSFGLGKGPDGKQIIGRGFGMPLNVPLQQFSINLPRTFTASEIAATALDSLGRNVQKQAASANPIISAMAEQLSGKNLYFNKPLNSKFLRKLPDWTALAQKVAPFNYAKIPGEALNELQVRMLGAVKNPDGTYTADPGLYWLATHVIPGFGRGVGTAKALSDQSIPTSLGSLRALTGLRIEDADIERTGLFDERERLQGLMNDYSVKERLNNG